MQADKSLQWMYLQFYAHLSSIFIFEGVELGHFFPSEMLRGCLVCVICNSNNFNSLILKNSK